jgi:hypothetical protein
VPQHETTPVCSCCERAVPYTRGSMWHHDHRVCLACFYVWYDEGLTQPEEIKNFVLKAEADRTFPFTFDTAKFERVETNNAQ